MMIIKCTCSHEFQDALYGMGNRVCNPCTKRSDGSRSYRCTVCSTMRETKAQPKPKK